MSGSRIPVPAFLRRLLVAWSCGVINAPLIRSRYSVAVVKLDRLGDFILAVATIRRIAERFGEKNCLLVVSSIAEEIAAQEFPFATRVVLPCSILHLRTAKIARHFKRIFADVYVETVVCLRHQRWDYDEIVLSWLHCGQCIRTVNNFTRKIEPSLRYYDYDGAGAFAEKVRVFTEETDGMFLCKELERNRQVLCRLLGREVEDREVLPTFPPLPIVSGNIVVSPLGSESIRNFPGELLILTIQQAMQLLKRPVMLIGQDRQRGQLEAIAAKLKDGGIDVSIQTGMSLSEYLKIVGSAPIVITTETATAHIAVAYDRPTLVVIGGGHYGEFAPWQRSRRQRWLIHHLDCEGCNWHCRYPTPECLTKIRPEEIIKAVESVLAET